MNLNLSFYYLIKFLLLIAGLLFIQVFILELNAIITFTFLKSLFGGFEFIRVIILWQFIVFCIYMVSIIFTGLVLRSLYRIYYNYQYNNFLPLIFSSILIPFSYLFSFYTPLFGIFDWEFNENIFRLILNLILGIFFTGIYFSGESFYRMVKLWVKK